MSRIRLDQAVQELFPKYSRSKIKILIEKAKVEVFDQQWKLIKKPGHKIERELLSLNNIRILQDDETLYVSRGALKLREAVEQFNVPVKGLFCLDVGLSTGGFSDYLLQHGASRVLGVDVGREQLHPSLKANKKLIFEDKVNAREPLSKGLLDRFFTDEVTKLFDLIVIDVSFISLDKIIPNICTYLKQGGSMVGLIKPQFELTRADLNKKGVVKDEKKVAKAVEKIIGVLLENKLEIAGTCLSPIEGENGNKEFLFVSHLR